MQKDDQLQEIANDGNLDLINNLLINCAETKTSN